MSNDNNNIIEKDPLELTEEERQVLRSICEKYQIKPTHFLRLMNLGFQNYAQHELCFKEDKHDMIYLSSRVGRLFVNLEK